LSGKSGLKNFNSYGMYKFFKAILLKCLSKKLVLKYEPFFRNIYSFFYSGSKYQCPICESKLRKFTKIFETDLLCPKCGSLSRHRRLYVILKNEFLRDGIKILDFSPSRCLYRKFKSIETVNYTATDFCDEFIADTKMDITNIKVPDESFDLIICYHILEHVKDDAKALSELYRVLKTGGAVLVQTPFKEGNIYENDTVTTAEERKKHFGQEDHVRIYSIEGLCARIEKAGFKTETKTYSEISPDRYGFSSKETVIAGIKS
jgi:SAM-dependent methyltransferase